MISITWKSSLASPNGVGWPQLIEARRREILTVRLSTVYGVWETGGKVSHLIAKRAAESEKDAHVLGQEH